MTRRSIATAILVLACFNTAQADEMSDKLAECRAIESDAERVACYDALAGGQARKEAVPAAVPAAAPVAVEATAEVETAPVETPPAEETFGKPADDLNREADVPAGSDKVDEITATVTGIRLYKRDRVILTLDNGQEWRQTSASTKTFSVGDRIEIRKGAFGSYRMTEVDGSRAMKVRRID
jgi:hypothetical protein